MNTKEAIIHELLKVAPDCFYVTPEDDELYLLVEGGMIVLTRVGGFAELNDAELNKFICDSLDQLTF